MTTNTLFNDRPSNDIENTDLDELSTEDKNYLEELVGEGKKFKTVQDLAKGKATSDGFIEKLKTELSTLRTELRARKTVEELLAEKNSRNVEPNPRDNQEEVGTNVNNETLSLKDIESILDRKLTSREQDIARQRNLEQVKGTLEELWGSNYGSKLAQVARENNYSQSMLEQMAQENPNAFYRLVDLNPPTRDDYPQALPLNTKPQERTLGAQRKPGNGWSYWKERQKSLGDSFFSTKEQQALWADMQKFASQDDFYNS